MTTLLWTVLSTVEGAEEEGSKAAFYIAGGLLAGWAVVLGLLGTMRPTLPASEGAARAIMGISAVLVVAACASAAVTG